MSRIYRKYPDGWHSIAVYERFKGRRHFFYRVWWRQVDPVDEYGNLSKHDWFTKDDAESRLSRVSVKIRQMLEKARRWLK